MLAAPLMSKLKVNRQDGKKGSVKPTDRDPESIIDLEDLKEALKEGLEVFQIQPDQPFVLETDASRYSVGAVLEQERDGKGVPVGYFNRKINSSQINWTPREKETYAIVASLHKLAGLIGFQPLVLKQTIGAWKIG